MFRRGLAILLCSAMLVGSLPEISFAAENVETTETVEAETEVNGDSPESEKDTPTSKAAVSETQTTAETEKTETKETEKTETKETEKTETEKTKAEETETKAAEGNEDASEDLNETKAQETEKTETKETETVNPTEEPIVIETTMETEETTIVGTEEESMEEETEEEASAEEIENTAQQNGEILGNEYITISNVKVTYNSISFDYQNSGSLQYMYIGSPKMGHFIDGDRGSMKITGLSPETEYEICFSRYAYEKEKYFSFTKTTAECPYDVKYEISSTEANTIRLTAEITAKEGAEYVLPEQFILNWNCFDENGKCIIQEESYYGDILEGSLPAKITYNYQNPQYIFENTKYTFEVWVSEPYIYNDGEYRYKLTSFARESGKEVTTAKSAVSNVEVTFKQNASNPSIVEYTLTTGNYKDRVDGEIFWRLKGMNGEWDYTSFSTENGSAAGEIEDLSIGSTYEYLINAAGFKKTGEFTNGEAKLKWQMSYDVGAIDTIITFQIDEATKTPEATYEVYGSYRRHASNYSEGDDVDKQEGSEDVYIARNMYPNTEYDIKFTIYEYLPDGSENRYTALGTVTTKASVLKTTITKTYIDGVRYKTAFDPSVRTKYTEYVTVHPYVKNQDGKYILLEDADEIVLVDADEIDLIYDYTIRGLESNKTYEISFGYMDYNDEDESGNAPYFEYGTMTFKTPADDRTVTIDAPETGVNSFNIKGTFKGSTFSYDYDTYTTIVLLSKESGSDEWNCVDEYYVEIYVNEESVEQKFTLTAFDLKSDKSYDYAVGIVDNGFSYRDPDINKLKDVKKGTIKLNADERSVEVTDTISLLDGVEIRAKLTGRYIDNYNTAYMFYREKGKTDASWETIDLYFASNEGVYDRETYSIIRQYSGEALKSGTTFEYKLCMAEKVPEKEEDYAKLEGGEFTYTQPTDDRALDVEVIPSRTSVRTVITLTGSSSAINNYVTIFYKEKGSESWGYRSRIISNQSTVYDIILGLNSETEYEYIVGISNDGIYDVKDIVTGKQTGTFTTKDERKLGTPVITTGYTYADIAVEVDGLTIGEGSTYVSLYTKDAAQQDSGWLRSYRNVYSYNNTAQFNLSDLEQGKTYDYVFVISDSYRGIDPDSEEFGKLPADKKLVSTFTTRKSDYTLEITEDEKSVFDKEILNLKAVSAAGFNEKNFDVMLRVRESETGDLAYNATMPLNSADYTAQAVITDTYEKTKYDVEAILYAKSLKDNSIIREQVATAQFSFTTKAVAAPTELKADVEEVWLNSWNQENQSYSMDVVRIIVPDGVSDEVTWTSSNEDIVHVLNSGILFAGKPGEATITAASVLNPSVKATVQVHVKNYGVIFTDTQTPSLYNSIYTLKNTNSSNIAYASITDDGTQYKVVEASGTSDDPNIAEWDKEKQCVVAKNVGSTWIVLDSDGFKTDLYVTVYADSPDFDIKVSPTEEYVDYPALKTDSGYQIAAGVNDYYQVSVNANPETLSYDIYDVVSFVSSDPGVLTVSDSGFVRGLKKGTATVTVAYDMEKIKALIAMDEEGSSELKELAKHTDLASKTKTVTFDVRPLSTQSLPEVHAITNIQKTLKDVTTLGQGWTWRDPETPLYSLPNSGNAYYEFEAEYTGTEFYNYEGTVKVYISTIAGVDVTSSNSNVISSDGKDYANLTVKPIVYGYTGLMEGSDYSVVFPAVQNVTVTQDTTGYKVTASKKGKYTLKPEIKVGDTVVATGNYTITAVDGKLIDHIDIEPVTDNMNVTIKGSMIYFDSNAGVDSFKLKATAYDRDGNVSTDTKLAWTITDKSVADIDAKTSDREVTVKVKGDGHAVIQVTSGDAAKASSKYRLEARNRKPRVEGDKITINTAYDYDTSEGVELSAVQYGSISVATAYGEDIDKVEVVSADVEDGIKDLNGKISKDFRANEYDAFWLESGYARGYEGHYVIEPVNPDMAAGKHNVKLAVTTASGFVYTYPLAITVMNKQPKVTAKISNSMNLFYLNEKGHLDITLEKNKSKNTDFAIESLKWSGSTGEGFRFDYTGSYITKTPNVKRCYIDGSKVKVSNGKLINPAAATGTVTIRLAGVRKQYELPVTVKYSYKKPKLTTADSMTKKNTSTIISTITGGKSGSFYVYADKKLLYYNSDIIGNARYYNERRCGNDKVTIGDTYNTNVSFTYSGTEEQFEIPLTLDSYNWREPLTVTHKVKSAKPTAVLSNAKLTFNTNYDGEVSAKVYLKDYSYAAYTLNNGNTYSIISAVDVAGADAASQELLTSGKLQMKYTGWGNVSVKMNAAKLGSQVPKGASYVLTPYYFDSATGENKPLNALTLKITFVNKAVTASISGKGAIDLTICDTYGEDYYKWMASNSIVVTPKFANLSSGYSVVDVKLTGEYSKYFALYEDEDSYDKRYIKISEDSRGMLKAGQNYSLSVIYTLEDEGGNRMTVKSSKALKVKPVQKAPKLTIAGDNRILYTASPSLYRECEIRTPYYNTKLDKDYYIIESAYGFIDANKDGNPDIDVRLNSDGNYYEEGYAFLRIELRDEDAVAATVKGKSYTIPVTVRLVGRDGISKDAVVKVKVIVKR